MVFLYCTHECMYVCMYVCMYECMCMYVKLHVCTLNVVLSNPSTALNPESARVLSEPLIHLHGMYAYCMSCMYVCMYVMYEMYAYLVLYLHVFMHTFLI